MGESTTPQTPDNGTERKRWGFKDLRDFLDVVGVPLAVVTFGALVAAGQTGAQIYSEDVREQRTILQSYLDVVQTLLIEEDLRLAPENNTDARNLARAWTVTTLAALDWARSGRVLRFLRETGLIQTRTDGECLHPDELSREQQPVVSLKYVDLRDIDLRRESRTLSRSDLTGARLGGADLQTALLCGTDLTEASLTGADLSGTDLTKANLTKANLTGADLSDADLEQANLTDAVGVTNEELEQQAVSLQGAIMPDGSKHD